MTSLAHTVDPQLARRVRADSLLPAQQPTPVSFLKKPDCYQQRALKYPGLAVFHSYAEFIHWLLCEASSLVTSFVPQPFRLHFNGRFYIPDAYLVREGQPRVMELKARGVMDPALQAAVTAFFDWHNLPFAVLDNAVVLEQETLALHWLPLIQVLAAAERQGVNTQSQEFALLDRVLTLDTCQVGDILDAGQREERLLSEIALYRLLHRHRLVCDLSRYPLDFDTEIRPC